MSNSLSPEQFAELCELAQLVHDRRITSQQMAYLEEWISRDENACDIYIQYMYLHASLHWRMAQSYDPEKHGPSLGKSSESETLILGFLGNVFQAGTNFLSRSIVLTLLLTIGLPGILFLILMLHISSQPTPVAPTMPGPVAKVTRMVECVWDKSVEGVSQGDPLMMGQQLRLRQGLVELHFADGVNVIIEGPATFDVQNKQQGFLQVGNLVANVPKGAEGFTIVTPSARIVDLGTEFGVSVLGNGTVETHVFQGEVEVATQPAKKNALPLKKRLHAGEAVKVSIPGPDKEPEIVAMATAEGKFARHVPGTLAEPTIIFAHRGSKDPTTEGWRLRESKQKKTIEIGPVDQNGKAAWSFRSTRNNQYAFYSITELEGLDPKLVAEANQKGWVMRARIWISDQSKGPKGKNAKGSNQGLCHFGYTNNEQSWVLHPALSPQGDQVLILCGKSSLGNLDNFGRILVPDSRNKYVDYELRYHPNTKSADVFINGRRVATGFKNFKDKVSPGLRFGMWKYPSDTRYALFEWGILREKPDLEAGGIKTHRDE